MDMPSDPSRPRVSVRKPDETGAARNPAGGFAVGVFLAVFLLVAMAGAAMILFGETPASAHQMSTFANVIGIFLLLAVIGIGVGVLRGRIAGLSQGTRRARQRSE